MKISIVTIVFNDIVNIEKTIKSVLTQTYKNIQYIIIDGGSNDGTVEIIKKYERNIFYWESSSDQGISDAFNKGLKQADGNYIQMLNSGDTFLNNKSLEEAMSLFTEHEIITFQAVTDTGNIFPKYLNSYITEANPKTIDEAIKNSMFSHQATFISKRVYQKVGGYNLNYKLRMDFDLFMRIQNNYNISYIKKPLVFYPTDGMSSKLKNRLNFKLEELRIIENYKKDIFFKIVFYFKLPFYIFKKILSAIYYNLRNYFINFSHGKLVTILQYFTDKVDDYWHIIYPITSNKDRSEDKYLYFYDISRKATDYNGQFTKDGLYMFLGYDGKYHLHALELSQYSLACWLSWRKSMDVKWVEKAMLHCDWLVNNQEPDGAWRIEHKNPSYDDLPLPWASGMAQGLAISSLLRAYMHTNDNKYLETAKKACDFLELGIKNHGVKRYFSKNNIKGFIYEEYPRKELNGVLNGYISAIIAIYELSCIDKNYKKQLDNNIFNLKIILPLYDLGYWSYYALDENIDSGFYHRYIIVQLESLEKIDIEFKEYKKIFKKYRDNRFYQLKAFFKKVVYKI